MKNKIRTIITCGSLGLLPASGTVASLVTMIFIILLSYTTIFINSFDFFYTSFVCLFMVVALYMVHNVLPLFKEKDPSEIVIDEVVGMLVTFWFVPLNYKTLLLGFCLFRFFDISKPLGIKYIEKLPGAWGIMLDDVAAGLSANACLQAFLYYGLV